MPSFAAAYDQTETIDTTPTKNAKRVWRPLGPFCIPHGQTYGSGPGCRPSISGRVNALAVDPHQPEHILIGSGGGGGIWETNTAGTAWAARSDDQPSLAIGAITFDPTNPKLVYAGTGEGDSTLADEQNMLGIGVLKSTNGGKTWDVLCRNPFERVGFYELIVDPTNGKHIFAATTDGLYESVDRGASWTRRLDKRTWSISLHIINNRTEVFAGCANGVFRSTNGGTAWARVNLPGRRRRFERIEVCHAPSDGNIVYIFAATPNLENEALDPVAHILRRNGYDESFHAIDHLPEKLVTEQAWYDWFAAVAPNNPDILYVGAVDAFKGFRSPTGSWRWENVSAQKFSASIHPDMHAIAFSPVNPNVIYIGCDGGVFCSADGGHDWVSLNKGLCLTEVEFLAQHPEFESWLIAGTQDNGTLQYQGNEVWYHISDGDGGDCGVSARYPYTCYITFYGMGVARSKKGGGWNTWPRPPRDLIGPNVVAANDYPDGALFYSPLEVNGRTVVQAGRKVCISTNGGDDWKKVTLPFSSIELSSALFLPTAERVFVGTTRGNLFRLDAAGKSWHQAKLRRPVVGNISDILVDPTNESRIYVTFSSSKNGSHVFRSDNGGADWNDISAGLPDIAVNAIEIDPEHPETIFIAADVGLYRSDDAGETWTLFNAGLPNVLVKDLAFHKPSRLLRAGTQARGVWEIPVDDIIPPSVDIYLRDNPVDSGRLTPSPFAVSDPFYFRAETFWWQSVDIKIDSSSLLTQSLDGLDFEIFGDDQSMIGITDEDLGIQFAAGLLPENPIRGQKVRVYVRVNNRGVDPAQKVLVKVLFAPATSIAFPDLPEAFWKQFPDDEKGPSLWQPVAAAKTLDEVLGGSSKIIGFEWEVPPTIANTVSLLAVASAENDKLETDELNISSLVTANKKCAVRNITVVNPSAANGPVLRAVPLNLTGTTDSQKFSLLATQTSPHVLSAVVLSKRLSKLAQHAALKRTKLTGDDRIELTKLLAAAPSLKQKLDTETAFVVPKGKLIESVQLGPESVEPMIFFINPKVTSGFGSLMQVADSGKVVGGHTFQVLA